MLIACPNCTTSYMINPAALGPAGRTVRCARCKVTWFAGGSQPQAETYAHGIIMETGIRTAVDSAGAPSLLGHDVREPAATGDLPFGGPESLPSANGAPIDGGGYDPSASDESAAVTVESPSLIPSAEHESGGAESDSQDIESFAARRERLHARRKQARRSSRWIAVVLVLFAVNVTLVGARNEVVRYLPQTASLFAAIGLPVNLRHLKFENVKIAKETQNGANVLIVHGSIVSTADEPIAVPRLRFAARDAAGQEIYTWTALPSRSILGPGERLDFRSRLTSPPADASSVMVRFYGAQDTDVGIK